jgi:formylglycine-generating enzyme required for sulfatase activity
MNKKTLLFMIILGCITFSEADFKGSVVNQDGEAIPGAIVTSVSQPELNTVTDENGAFDLATRIVAVFGKDGMLQPLASLQGNHLEVSAECNDRIEISLFSCKGRQLFYQIMENLSGASRKLDLPEIAAGFYLLNVTSRGKTISFGQVFSSGSALSVRKAEHSTETPVPTAKKAAAAEEDTLIALATGYYMAKVAVTDAAAEGITITMEASTQYQSAGEFEHEGSMVKINASGRSFIMGQAVPMEMKAASDNWVIEQPPHRVTFTYDYWMDTTEVTQKQFTDIMVPAYTLIKQVIITAEGDTVKTNDPDSIAAAAETLGADTILPLPAWSATYGLGDNIPGYFVNKYDAMLFCNARSKTEELDTVYSYSAIIGKPGGLCTCKELVADFNKNGYRLPTEAEWEYACRGGTVTDYFWGKNYRPYPETTEDTAEIDEYVLWGNNSFYVSSDGPDYGVRRGAASKKPNGYGLYDMLGSLSEWYHVSYVNYPVEEQIDPKPTTMPTDTVVSARGGNWGNDVRWIRAATRIYTVANYDYYFLGIRTVREVE